MKNLSYLEVMGWSGPQLHDLAGRDLTVTEQGESRRGPITIVRFKPIEVTRSLVLSFYVD